MESRRLGGAAVIGAALVLGVGVAMLAGDPGSFAPEERPWWQGMADGCPQQLTTQDRITGVGLAASWLAENQVASGLFVHERNWEAKTMSGAVQPVDQATATWAVTRLAGDDPVLELDETADAALEGWIAQSETDGPNAWISTEPDGGQTAVIALVSLALTERLATAPSDHAQRERWSATRDRLLSQLQRARRPDHRIRAHFELDGRYPTDGAATAEADATTLLALVAAAMGDRPDLQQPALALWRATWLHGFERPHKAYRDPPETKALFPWLPLALGELARSEWLDAEDAGPQLMELATWMVDDHQMLRRAGNTAYAQLGIAEAVRWGQQVGHPQTPRLACVLDRGLERLLTLQVGHPHASSALDEVPEGRVYRGGVAHSDDDHRLRLDHTALLPLALNAAPRRSYSEPSL